MPRTLPKALAVLVLAFPASFALAADSGGAPAREHLSLSVDAFVGGHFFADGTNLGVASAPEASAGAKNNALVGLRATLGLGAWAAAEAEVFGMITPDRTYDLRADVLGYRLNAIAYLLSGNLRPFALLGAGAIEIVKTYADGNAGLVRDRDGEFHVGVGLDYRLLDFLSVRADARTVEMPGKRNWSLATDFEAMLGMSVGFGRGPRAPAATEAPAAPASQGLRVPAPVPPAAPAPVPVPPVAPVPGSPLPSPPASGSPAPAPLPPASVQKPSEKAPFPVAARPATAPAPVSSVPAAAPVASVKELVGRAKELKFDGSSSRLSLTSLPLVGQLAEAMMKEPGVELEIVAHTAGSGDAGKDMALSKRRAEAVKSALVEREVAPSRLTATGRGSEEPLAPNITRTGRKRNERMELRVSASP